MKKGLITTCPTRGIIRENKSGNASFLKKIWSKHLYINWANTVESGRYFHYKINTPERFQKGYKLGDRKKPEVERQKTRKFKGEHPSIVQRYFG